MSRDGQEQLALGELMVSMGWVGWRHRAPGEFSFREANATGEVVWNSGVASLPVPQGKARQGMNSQCALLWATPSRHTHANSGCSHSIAPHFLSVGAVAYRIPQRERGSSL